MPGLLMFHQGTCFCSAGKMNQLAKLPGFSNPQGGEEYRWRVIDTSEESGHSPTLNLRSFLPVKYLERLYNFPSEESHKFWGGKRATRKKEKKQLSFPLKKKLVRLDPKKVLMGNFLSHIGSSSS